MSPILVGLFDFHLGYLCHFSLSWVFLNIYVTMLIPSEKSYAWVLLKKKKKKNLMHGSDFSLVHVFNTFSA